MIPIVIIFLLFLINLFSGVLFSIDESLNIHFSLLYNITVIINLLYFAISLVTFFRYKSRKGGNMAFFSILPFLIPVAAGALGELWFFYKTEPSGFAAGLVFLYFSMIQCWMYEDADSSFYNHNYLHYVRDCMKAGNSKIISAAIFSGKNAEALAQILKEELPVDHETVKLEEHRYIFLSQVPNKNYLQGLTDLVLAAADTYDQEHPENPISFSSECRFAPDGRSDSDEWLADI